MFFQTPGIGGGVDSGAGANTSLMVRGASLLEISETQVISSIIYLLLNLIKLLDIFCRFAPIKDIRMVKNKNTGQMRDFAFIEFYTIEVALLDLNIY